MTLLKVHFLFKSFISFVGMIDSWSLAHSILVILATIGQVYFLRRLFKTYAGPQRTNIRT